MMAFLSQPTIAEQAVNDTNFYTQGLSPLDVNLNDTQSTISNTSVNIGGATPTQLTIINDGTYYLDSSFLFTHSNNGASISVELVVVTAGPTETIKDTWVITPGNSAAASLGISGYSLTGLVTDDVVKIKWFTSSGTASVTNRSMSLIKVG